MEQSPRILNGKANQSHIVSPPQQPLATRSMASSSAIERRPPPQPAAPASITRPAPVYRTPRSWAGGGLANIPRGFFCVARQRGTHLTGVHSSWHRQPGAHYFTTIWYVVKHHKQNHKANGPLVRDKTTCRYGCDKWCHTDCLLIGNGMFSLPSTNWNTGTKWLGEDKTKLR